VFLLTASSPAVTVAAAGTSRFISSLFSTCAFTSTLSSVSISASAPSVF